VLLDPEGRVVDFARKPGKLGSQVCEEFLASKLTPIPPAKRIDRALDRAQSLGVDDEPLNELMSFYSRVGRIPIRLDPSELKSAGIEASVRVPLKVSDRLTLRSWLNLTLDPFGLTYADLACPQSAAAGQAEDRQIHLNVRQPRSATPRSVSTRASSPRVKICDGSTFQAGKAGIGASLKKGRVEASWPVTSTHRRKQAPSLIRQSTSC
jgi:hypothetical protein